MIPARGWLTCFRRHDYVVVISCLLFVFVLGIAPTVVSGIPQAGNSHTGSITISDCQRISESGTYVLARDLEAASDSPCLEIIGTDSVVIEGNGFAVSKARVGVEIIESSGVVVRNLSVTDIDRVGIEIIESDSVEIHRNYLSNIGTAQQWPHNGIHSWRSTDLAIHDNTVVNSSNYGIYAGRTKNAKVRGNTVLNVHWSIFTAQSNAILIERNTVENPDTNGNAIAGTHIVNVTVANNFINRTRYGIEAKPNSTDVVIRNNVIKNTDLCSIEAEGHDPGEAGKAEPGRVSDVVIEDNVMNRTGPLGVWVNTSGIVVRNNTVRNAPGLGMYVRGVDGPVEISRNRFVNSGSAAIRINNTRGYLRIFENEIRDHETGLRMVNTADIRIERNRFIDVSRAFEEHNVSGLDYRNNTYDQTHSPGQAGFGVVAGVIAILFLLTLIREFDRQGS